MTTQELERMADDHARQVLVDELLEHAAAGWRRCGLAGDDNTGKRISEGFATMNQDQEN